MHSEPQPPSQIPTTCAAPAESALHAILETAVDGIVVIDQQGVIQAVNQAVTKVFGYPREQLIGQPVSMLMPEPYRSNHQRFILNYLQSRESRIIGIGEREVPGLTRTGEIIPLELGISECTLETGTLFTAILRDISERKTAQQALIDSYMALEQKQAKLDDDLQAAAAIQLSLLPQAAPEVASLDVSWFFQPSSRIGGDIFNLIPLSADHLGIYIVDVSGHGVPAALIAVAVSQVMQREGCLLKGPWMDPSCVLTPPSEVLEFLDREFPFERFNTYFTISYLILNVHTGHLQYSNAGHPFPLLIRKSGQIVSLETEGTIIGLGGVLPFSTGTVQLQKDDTLALYTDGVYEQANTQGLYFGWKHLAEELIKYRHLQAHDMVDNVINGLYEFSAQSSFSDDVSLVCIKYTKSPQYEE